MLQELHGDNQADDGGEGNPVGVSEALNEEAEADGSEDDGQDDCHGRSSGTAASVRGARSVRTHSLPAELLDLRRPVNKSANFQKA